MKCRSCDAVVTQAEADEAAYVAGPGHETMCPSCAATMQTETVEFDGLRFAPDAIDRAALVDDGEDGAHWEVPTIDGGTYETTDEGLRLMRDARGRAASD